MPIVRQLRETYPWIAGSLTAMAAGATGIAALLPLAPFARERAISFFVEAAQAGIFKTIRARLGPSRCNRVGKETFADKLWMSTVAAVVNNASPVDELVTAPRCRHPQR